MVRSVRAAASSAGDSTLVETGARLGYAASGFLHLVIAWVALQLAWSQPAGDADQSGALRALASTGLGSLPLWIGVAGFAFLGLWQLTEALVRRDTGTRVKSAGKGLVYLALAWSTVAVARGSGASGSQQTVDFTATLMAKPFGRVLVGALGVVVIGVGGYHVVKGWKAKFLTDLRSRPGPWTVRAGRFGYVAKGFALALVGILFVGAAATRRPEKARGLDGALRTVLQAPLGSTLLTLVALGFAAYGVYSFARARHARV